MSKNYPEQSGHIEEGGAGYENHCAIRMSHALELSGVPLANYREPVCKAGGITHARGAESLANYLWKIFGPPKILSAGGKAGAKGKKGIVFFKAITGFRGGRDDHIELWDGENTRGLRWLWALHAGLVLET